MMEINLPKIIFIFSLLHVYYMQGLFVWSVYFITLSENTWS